MSTPGAAGLDAALAQERLRLHADNTWGAVGASALAAGVLLLLCAPHLDTPGLLLWCAALALSLGARVAVAGWQRRQPDPAPPHPWLLLHRAAYGLHGLAWGALALWALPIGDHTVRQVVTFTAAAMAGGSLITGAFDPRASFAFVLPTVLPLFLQGGAQPDAELQLVAGLFVGMMALASRRASALFVDRVRSIQAEQLQVQEARRSAVEAEAARRDLADQHELTRQLIQGTAQGYWFVSPEGQTLEINPAMCTLLGRRREEVMGRAVFDFFNGPERAVLERELALRRSGRKGGYEVDIVRPDGSRVHAFNNATPIYRADGSHMGSVGLWTDLTPLKELERELRTYERVANSISDPVSVVGSDRRLLLVNDAWCTHAGVAREVALGQPVVAYPLQLDPQAPLDLVERCFSGGAVELRSAEVRLADGRSVRLQTQCHPYRDAEGEVRAVILVSRDVTEQERAVDRMRHHEAELRALFDAFPGFIAAADAELRYQIVNARAAELIGRPVDELLQRHLREVQDEARALQLEAELRRAADGEVLMVDRSFPATATRGPLEVEVTVVAGRPGPDGRRMYYWFGVDVSARKRALDALARARDEAERANRAKSRFLSHMSHELRTPLNAIMGFAQLLERDRRAPLAPQQLGWVGQILRGAQHLSQLIGEVLDLARIEAGQLALEPTAVPLPELADECLAFVRELARSRGIRLLASQWPDGAGVPVVAADRTRLKQVLLNLLSNAIKYNRPGGEVQLGCRPDGERLRVWVRDTGHGLSPQQQARLFQPFERLGAERGTVEGSGIGLLVSRHLVEAMGGHIGVDSREGEGSEFWLRLPAADTRPPVQAAAGAALAGDAPEPVGAPATVLCVDDNAVNLMLLEAMLEEACGVQAVCVDAPLQALAEARRVRPQLVLLDIHMPGLSGYEVLARLKADPVTADVPVIAVSADAHAHEIETARSAGFADYLTKPIDLDALRTALARQLPAAGPWPG